MRQAYRLVLCAVIGLLGSNWASAEVFYWGNPSDGVFSVGDNWRVGGSTPDNPPGVDDTAVFDVDGGAPYTVTFDSETVNQQADLHAGNVTWDLSGNMYQLTASTGHSLQVGINPVDTVDLTVHSGWLEARGNVWVGKDSAVGGAATGSVRVTGTESAPTQLTIGHDDVAGSGLMVGHCGNGVLNIDGYASVIAKDHLVSAEGAMSSPWVFFGGEATGHGIGNITGPNALLSVEHAPVMVGGQGWGEIYITDGGSMSMGDGELWVAVGPASKGSVWVSGVGSSLIEDSAYSSVIGQGGEGSLTVTAGGYARFAHLCVGGIDLRSSEQDHDEGNIHLGVGTVSVKGSGTLSTGGTILESRTGAIGLARDDVTDPSNPRESRGTVTVEGTAGDPATWRIETELAIGGSMGRRGGQGELSILGPDSFVSVGAEEMSGSAPIRLMMAAPSATVRIWENGWLNVADGRMVIGDSVYDEPGTVRIGSGGTLDMVGGMATLSAVLPDSGDITVGRVNVGGRLQGHGTIEGHVHVAGGTVENSSGQTLLVTGQMLIGVNGETGTAAISGEGSKLQVNGRPNADNIVGLELGSNDGVGELSLYDGGQADVAWAVVVGGNTTGSGTLNISDAGSKLTLGHDLAVGRDAPGRLYVGAGGAIEQTSANGGNLMGVGVGAAGEATVTGDQTNVQIGRLDIGDRAAGSMWVQDQANVAATGQLLMGRNGGAATLVVEGQATLTTGAEGSGTNSSGIIGGSRGPDGPNTQLSSVTVDNATWNQTGVLSLGFRAGANGELAIRNGGVVTSLHGVIARAGAEGDLLESTGQVSLAGPDSLWDVGDGAGEIGVGGLTAGANIGGASPGVDVAGGVGGLAIGSGATVRAGRVYIFSQGTVDLDGGTLASTQTIVEGVLKGNGSIDGSVTLASTGSLSPGHSVGVLNLMGSLNLSGTTVMEIEGIGDGQFDQIFGMGSLSYGGILELNFAGGYAGGDAVKLFQFIGYDDLTRFDGIVCKGLSAGQTVDFDYANGIVTVVPEPATMGLVGLGLGVLLLARRRRV